MIHFIEVAQPFALMFIEIWDYLSTYTAYKSSESLSIRFGFRDSDNPTEVTLEQFRKYVETSGRILFTVKVWPEGAIYV